jgi:hypothetical protein
LGRLFSSFLAFSHGTKVVFTRSIVELSGPNAFVDSPCNISLANVRSLQLIQCELVSRALTAALTGQKPQNVKVRNSAVPQNVLQPFLTGLKTLVPDAHLKPLRLGTTK